MLCLNDIDTSRSETAGTMEIVSTTEERREKKKTTSTKKKTQNMQRITIKSEKKWNFIVYYNVSIGLVPL